MAGSISLKDFESDPSLRERARRGLAVAKALDAQADLPYAIALSSADFGAFLSQLTPKRMELLRLALARRRSISELAQALGREQSAVSKDVARLKALGLVNVEPEKNAGHGQKKMVSAVARSIVINATLGE
jgi:predicted transcriptional regulator